jgi:hypothetical protein
LTVTTATDSERLHFSFGPRQTGGVLLGLRLAQLAAITGSLLVLVASLSFGFLGVVGGAIVMSASLIAVFLPFGGRTAEQWAPVAIGYAYQRLAGQHQFRGAAVAGQAASSGPPPLELPGILAGTTILAVPVDNGQFVAVIKDARRHTYAAVMSARGNTFALLEAGDQRRRVESWGGLLAALAREGSPVSRLQWVERTVPDAGNALQRYWTDAGSGTGTPASRSYQDLIAAAGPVTQSHQTYLVLTIDVKRCRRGVKQAGGGDDGACTVLLRELAALQDRLAQASIDVTGWLPPRALAKVLRTAVELRSAAVLDAREAAVGLGEGVDTAVCGPMAAENNWSHYRTDDALHATYWVHEWPRMAVGADFLAPLLLQTSCRRAVALIAEPLSPRRAAQQVKNARTAEIANRSMRAKHGQVTTARHQAESDEVERQERELVAGHAQYRFIAYITVSATSESGLEEACGQVEQLAHQSFLEIRRLYGEQDQAFAATLPVGRGLR